MILYVFIHYAENNTRFSIQLSIVQSQTNVEGLIPSGVLTPREMRLGCELDRLPVFLETLELHYGLGIHLGESIEIPCEY